MSIIDTLYILSTFLFIIYKSSLGFAFVYNILDQHKIFYSLFPCDTLLYLIIGGIYCITCVVCLCMIADYLNYTFYTLFRRYNKLELIVKLLFIIHRIFYTCFLSIIILFNFEQTKINLYKDNV
jgi:hypothetical protein